MINMKKKKQIKENDEKSAEDVEAEVGSNLITYEDVEDDSDAVGPA
jgi:hypothetical protein